MSWARAAKALGGRPEARKPQGLDRQAGQRGQDLHAVDLAVAAGILLELGVAGPVLGVLNRPALSHVLQQGCGRGPETGVAPIGALDQYVATGLIDLPSITSAFVAHRQDRAPCSPSNQDNRALAIAIRAGTWAQRGDTIQEPCAEPRVNIRRLFARSARLPDFLCIGAQKAGTTTLHNLLRHHREIFVPEVKETHFFTRNFNKPLSWYQRQFSGAQPRQSVGEVTPYYLFHPAAPARIAAQLPRARLIVLMRDPVERALSGYFHSKRHGMEPLPIDEAFEAEAERLHDAEQKLHTPGKRHLAHEWHSYLARSRYDIQLARYLALFPASQLLIVRSEDLFTAPAPIWKKIQDFLNLRSDKLPEVLPHSNHGAGEAVKVAARLRQRLREQLTVTYQTLLHNYGIAWSE